jgi:hypothetical protein
MPLASRHTGSLMVGNVLLAHCGANAVHKRRANAADESRSHRCWVDHPQAIMPGMAVSQVWVNAAETHEMITWNPVFGTQFAIFGLI